MKKLSRLEKDSERNKALRKGARSAAKMIQKEAKALSPKDTGKLRKSIKVRAMKRSRKWIGSRVVSQFKGEEKFYGWAVHQLNVEYMFLAEKKMHSRATNEFVSVVESEIEKMIK